MLQNAFGAFILSFIIFSAESSFSQVTNCPRSQKQADLWYFGEKAGIDFRNGAATAITDQDVMTSFKGSAIICDSLGNLQFFTNAKLVWDRTFNPMPYSPSLEGDLGVTQPCIILPQPGDSNLYYIFTLDVLTYKNPPADTLTPDTRGLKVSVVNMNGNNGLGDGTLRWNQPLLSQVSQKITAVKHQNKTDYWVIAHKWDSDEFYAYRVTRDGISAPVISKTGLIHGNGRYGHLRGNDLGYMKASPDGGKIALAVSGKNIVELLNFDNSTGVITSPVDYSFSVNGIFPYGIEFSSDSKKLYSSLVQVFGNGPPAFPSRVYQFDLTRGLINPTLLDSMPGLRITGMQLATDGRIYVAKTINLLLKKDSVDVIYNPTRPGIECNYNKLNNAPSGFSLSGRKGLYGFPNFIQSYFDRPTFTHDSVCHGDITLFEITNKANIDNVLWDFGDGSTSPDLSPAHSYAQPGNYSVKLKETFNGIDYSDSVAITIFPLPVINFGGDTILLYSGASVNLNAGEGFTEYLWSTNATTPVITVSSGGNYWARVKDIHCCYNSDTVYVNEFKYYVPNAFTPNGDGINDNLRITGLYENISFQMYVYDRWGRQIFETTNREQGWDGKINGKPAPADTYAWIIYIDFLGADIVTNGKVVYKGFVTLLR